MIKKKDRLVAEIMLLGVVIMWGYTFPLIKNILEDIPPFAFLAYRFLLAFLVLFFIFRDHLKKINYQTIEKGFIAGIFLFLGYFGQTVGTQFTTATKTAFITGISVVMVPIFSFFWIKEKIQLNSLIGVMMAVLGLFLMNHNGTIYYFNVGDSLVFLGAIGFALYIIAVHIYTRDYDYVQLVLIQLLAVCLMSFFMSLLFEREALHFNYDLNVLWAIILTGVFATGFALYLQNRFQRFSDPTKVAIIFSTEPVFGAFFSHLILGETTGIFGIIGGITIFIGMLIAQLGKDDEIEEFSS